MKLRIITPLLVGMAMAALPATAQAATVAHWPLDGNATDTAGGHNGADSNVDFKALPGWAGFNGSSSRITVQYSPALSPGAADVTASVTIQTTKTPGTGNFDFDLMRASPTGKMYKIELFPHGSVKAQAQCIFIGTSTRVTVHAGPSLNDGNPHLIVCHKTTNQVTLTVDNKLVGSANVTIGSINLKKNAVFALGYKPVPTGTDGDFYNGFMQDAEVDIG